MALRHLLVTGGSGYIGSRLIATALERGLFVTRLARADGAAHPRLRWYPWALGDQVPDAAMAGAGDIPPVDAVLHLAHDWNDRAEPNANLVGSRHVLEAARRHGARMVFCSSVSARPDALNRYGRVKGAIEALMLAPAELSARIGLVYGGPPLGQWGSLGRIVALAPVLPMLEAGTPVQPIHLDDLCEGLLRLCALERPARAVYGLADATPLAFGAFLDALARARLGRGVRFISIPFQLALALVDLAAKVPGLPRVDRERILGLAGLPVVDSRDSLAELGLELRPLARGLAPEPWERRRALLAEGAILLRYMLGRAPSPWAVRLYARGLGKAGLAEPLGLPAILRRCPPALRLMEPLGGDGPLKARLYIASLVAEATPGGAAVFYDHRGGSPAAGLARLVPVGLAEALCLPFRLILGRRWR